MDSLPALTDPRRFWEFADHLVATSRIVIDRPGGSSHPRATEIVYPFDYGYLEGTSGGDGEGIDVWRGSLPDARVTAAIMTVDLRKRDAEVKLLVGCTPAETDLALTTHSQEKQAAVLLSRQWAVDS